MSQDSIGNYPVAILAGGLATRLRPMTEQVPKALIPVAGEPFLGHQLRLLKGAGIRRAVLCVGYRGELIADEFSDGGRYGIELTYSYDGTQLLGTGGALKKALPLLGERFFVLYGDSYLPINYAAPLHAFLASPKRGLMTVFRNEGRWDASNVWFEDGVIKSYSKTERTPQMQHIDYGLGLFDPVAFSHWHEGQAFDLADVYQHLMTKKELAGYEVRQRFYEIGSPEGLAELDTLLRGQPLSATS